VPATRLVDAYHDHPGYIQALASSINNYWTRNGRPDRLVMSFHGVPRSSLDQGDPYHCHCMKTGRLLADELGLDREQFVISFQSRFGRAAWLKPYTEASVVALAAAGVPRVDVVCPGFVSDCLETLEEIAQEVRAAFTRAGGREFHYIPCLNEDPAWIEALALLAMENLQGWLAPPPDVATRAATLARATALGATR
jgi:ferrochelatase